MIIVIIITIIMSTQKCSRCNRELPSDQFKALLTNRITKQCLHCRNIGNKSRQKETSKHFILQQHYEKLKKDSGPCVVCGDNDPEHKEFDHIDSSKKLYCVLKAQSIELMNEESKKCQILCAKCHCKKTQEDLETNKKNKVYSENKGTERARKKTKRNREFVKSIKLQIGKCQNEECKDVFDPTNLSFYEFDHINYEDKVEGICLMNNKPISTKRIKEEIDKCVLLCRYCHRIKNKIQREERKENNTGDGPILPEYKNKKLTTEMVKEIRRLWCNTNIQQKDLAKQFNCNDKHISYIVNNTYWKDENYNPPENRPVINLLKRKFTDEQVEEIRKIWKEKGYTHRKLAEMFNCSDSYITMIVNNKFR